MSANHSEMLAVLELFRVVFRSIQRHYRSVQTRAGIGGAQLWALAQVAKSPGLKVGDRARGLAVHQSTASNLIRDLSRLIAAMQSVDSSASAMPLLSEF